MGQLIHQFDWSATPLGDATGWPPSLRTTLSIVLGSRFPMFLFWGPQLLCFYNDAYRPSLGDKHPNALGRPGAQVWPDIWPIIKPQIDQVLAGGQATWHQDSASPLYRNGRFEDTFWTYSYSPVRDEADHIAGVFVTCLETTTQVQGLRSLRQRDNQHRFLLELTDALRTPSDPQQIYYQAACLLGTYLGADRVGYAQDQGDNETIVVLRNFVNGVPDLQGTYRYADYGPLLTEFLAGRTVVRPDIARDPDLTAAQKEAHRALQLGATLNKPLLTQGRFTSVLFIHFRDAHAWSTDELTLLDGVADRIVLAAERAQAEEALRVSEARYRHLSSELEERVEARLGELRQANLDLQRSNDNLQTFAYIASHDLQEPLRKIQQFGDLLGSRLTDSVGVEERTYLERMQQSASRMSTLIRDLLSYSRLGTQRSTAGPVRLNELMQDELDILELLIVQTRAQIVVDPLPVVLGEASQLSQLFQNLLTNALKFHRPNLAPDIHISSQVVAAQQLPESQGLSQQVQFYHRIAVSDKGIGFDEKYLDRIFGVFQRLHSRGEYGGTGIGLAICARVVNNHGGVLTAQSQPGQGATFLVYLPLLDTEPIE